jgi:hypothetical protein
LSNLNHTQISAEKSENMPLPSDEKIVATAENVLGKFKTVFGKHPGFRPGMFSFTTSSGVRNTI